MLPVRGGFTPSVRNCMKRPSVMRARASYCETSTLSPLPVSVVLT